MRIRSIKPEFWRSEDISALDWETRFIFIGLWSYVDDNGVGVDRVALVTADLFADDLERDPRETFARVSRGLQKLSEAGRIVRYTVDGKDFLEIVNWSKHQRIDKPNKPRYPTSTSENAEIRENVASMSRESRESPATGTEEQGNRGTEENPPNPPCENLPRQTTPDGRGKALAVIREANLTARSVDAYRIAEAFSASLPVPIEGNLLAGIGVQIDKCLRSDIPPTAVVEGLKAWNASDSWSPTQIPNFVNKANNRAAAAPAVGKATQKAMGYDAALQELLQEVNTL